MTIEETIDALRNQFAIMEDARARVNTIGSDHLASRWQAEQVVMEVMLRQAWPRIDAALAEKDAEIAALRSELARERERLDWFAMAAEARATYEISDADAKRYAVATPSERSVMIRELIDQAKEKTDA